MASFAAENTQTMCFSFYDQKTPSWNSELKEINLGNTRPLKKVDIEVLKATNCSVKSQQFVCQARNIDISLLEPGRELRTSNGVFRSSKYATSW